MNDSFLKPLVRSVPQTDWVLIVIGITSVIYIISRILFPRYHTRIAYAFFNRYEATKLIGEKNVLFGRAGFLLNFVPPFCLAMLVFEQIGFLRPEILFVNPFLRFLGILVLVFVYFAGRILVIFIFGHSFEQKEIALRFNQIWLLQFENLGSFILIPSLALPFASGIIKVLAFVILWLTVALWTLYTIIRELELLKANRVSMFYMFLYLCSLEILPLWWAIQSIANGW